MVRRVKWWLAVAGTIAAFGGAALASASTSTQHYAEAELVVVRGGGPLTPGRLNDAATKSVAKLLDSNLIAADVVANLHLREQPEAVRRRIRSRAVAPGLLRVRVSDAQALRAQQVAQEVTLVFPQLVSARFTGRGALRAKIWDPAHDAGTSSRGWGESMGAATGASVLLWLLVLAPRRRRQRSPQPTRPPPLPAPEPNPTSNTVLQATVGTEEPAVPEVPPEPVAANGSHYNLVELESLVAHARERFPDRADEWQAYVFYLRDYASADGTLPANFHPLVEDVFSELLTGRR
jgi:hypothetical protein